MKFHDTLWSTQPAGKSSGASVSADEAPFPAQGSGGSSGVGDRDIGGEVAVMAAVDTGGAFGTGLARRGGATGGGLTRGGAFLALHQGSGGWNGPHPSRSDWPASRRSWRRSRRW